jgi:hypothetical protein
MPIEALYKYYTSLAIKRKNGNKLYRGLDLFYTRLLFAYGLEVRGPNLDPSVFSLSSDSSIVL